MHIWVGMEVVAGCYIHLGTIFDWNKRVVFPGCLLDLLYNYETVACPIMVSFVEVLRLFPELATVVIWAQVITLQLMELFTPAILDFLLPCLLNDIFIDLINLKIII